MSHLYYELKGCTSGELNEITKETWCSLRQEFCGYIKVCPLGYIKEMKYELKR